MKREVFNMDKELKERLDAFTFDEQMRISFTPNIIIDTVLHYSDLVQSWCRDNRIPDTIKLSRKLDEIKKHWYSLLRSKLADDEVQFIKAKSEEWRSLMNVQLTQLFYTMNNTLLQVYKSQEYLNVINHALTAIMMVHIAKQYNWDMNVLIMQRLPNWREHIAPHHKMLDAIEAIMLAYIPGKGNPLEEVPEHWKIAMSLSEKIFMKDLKSISYSS